MPMFSPLTDLSQARILLSNDDGIEAPGLAVLERIARTLSSDVWVVAPETEQSGAGHSLTIHRPLRIRRVNEKRFAVSGTPTDCVLLAVNTILRDAPPTLVLSGVNRGANLAEDVTYSGTVAAAMEGTLLGIPSVALSQVCSDAAAIRWETAERHAPSVIRRACSVGWGKKVLININFPDVVPEAVSGVEATKQGQRKIGDELIERIDPRNRPYIWIGSQRSRETFHPGSDIDATELRAAISVTPLSVDLTDVETLAEFQKRVFA